MSDPGPAARADMGVWGHKAPWTVCWLSLHVYAACVSWGCLSIKSDAYL